MDRILRWRSHINGRPWYHNKKTVIVSPIEDVNRKEDVKQEEIEKKPLQPEWKDDEQKILRGDQYSSYSYGGGRFGNQIIRNLAMSLIAEKFDLIMRYQRSEEIEQLGFTLFSGTKKYRKHKVVDERNYYGMLKRKSVYFNIRSKGTSFYQTKEITDDINIYLNSPKIMDQIIENNVHKERYKNNNDCFVHIRLGDVTGWTPGFEYYYRVLSQLKFDKLYISTDSPDHEIISKLRNSFRNLELYDTTLPDIMLFASTCKHVVLSYGSFSAVIGYLSFFSQVYYKRISNKTAWDWNSGDKNNMFNDKYTKIGQWKEIV